MKTLLLTGFDNKMQELGELTAPIMLNYASKHGMDFHCTRNYPPNTPAYWQKIVDIILSFDYGYKKIIWMDADIIITNPEKLPPGEKGFNASMDWGQDATELSHFSMCCFTAFPDSITLFEWIIANKDKYINGPFPEQTPMRELYKTNQDLMTIYPSRVFNAVPIEVHETTREPWQPGDWLCHLTMISFPERVALFHKIKSKL